MRKIRIGFAWIINKFSFISIITLIIFYARWFHISPESRTFYTSIVLLIAYIVCSVTLKRFNKLPKVIKIGFPVALSFVLIFADIQGFLLGLLILLSYITYSIFRFVLKRAELRIFYIYASVLLLAVNCFNISNYMPDVLDTINFDGGKYYLTHNVGIKEIDENYLQYTKWTGIFTYQVYKLGNIPYGNKFFIDNKTNEVSIINSFDSELIFTDSIPPRYYDFGPVQLGNHRYYASSKYVKDISCYGGFTCQVLTYTLYECEVDNTGCRLLPFEYTTGDSAGYSILEVNEATNEINFYLDMGEYPFKKTLIYTYGDPLAVMWKVAK